MAEETDYLVKGCGAMGMAFVDTLLQETDAHVTIVDPRPGPGGHWNDAYPFVSLHQPSILYGVASRRLGEDRIDASGDNCGFYELASGREVADYFRAVLNETFLASGRVTVHFGSLVTPDGEIRELASGTQRPIRIRTRLVDASRLAARIPLTHQRGFAVEAGVTCIPPNDLKGHIADAQRITVIGAGKTGLDVITWLLAQGLDAGRIRWIAPRDPWVANRRAYQPGPELLASSLAALADQSEIWAQASSIEDLCLRMEAEGHWLRLNSDVWPGLYHGAIATEADMGRARTIRDIVRLGRIVSIRPDAVRLEAGEIAASPGTLYVDCSASALGHTRHLRDKVFSQGRIDLQSVRFGQLCFSAALIAYLEVHGGDDAARNRLCQPTPMSDTVEEWIPNIVTGSANRSAWMKTDGLREWILGCRLDPMTGLIARLAASDPAIGRQAQRLRAVSPAADANLRRLSSAGVNRPAPTAL